MRVTVTQEDWDKAVAICDDSEADYECNCVLAQAILREKKVRPLVKGSRIEVEGRNYSVSKPAADLIDAFDYRHATSYAKKPKPEFPKTYILKAKV